MIFFQLLLSFFRVCLCAAVHLLGLTWHLRHGESQLYENGLSSGDHQQEEHGKSRPTSSVHLLDTLNPENTHGGDKGTPTAAAGCVLSSPDPNSLRRHLWFCRSLVKVLQKLLIIR